ncbi:MAG: hypothetical protein ACNI27_05095 [Desulfovibrio sp.]
MKKIIPVLLLILALAGGAAASLSYKGGTAEVASIFWPAFEPDAVERLNFSREGKRFSLVNEDGKWFVEAAGDGSLRPFAVTERVQKVCSALSTFRPEEVLGVYAEVDADEYGFSEHSLMISVFLKEQQQGKTSWVYAFGGSTNSGRSLFAESSAMSGQLLIVPEQIKTTLDHDEFYFVERTVFPDVEFSTLERVGMFGAKGAYWDITLKGDKAAFEAPLVLVDKKVSLKELKYFLHTLTTLKAKSFVHENIAYDKESVLRYTLTGKSNKKYSVELYTIPGRDDVVYGTSTLLPAPFLLDKTYLDVVSVNPLKLQGRTIVDLDAEDVSKVRIASGDSLWEAMKSDGVWMTPDKKKELFGIDMTLWRFIDLKFEAEPSRTLPVSAERQTTCEFLGENKVLELLSFYQDPQLPQGQCWVKVGAAEMYYPVFCKVLDDLQGQMSSVKE